MVAVEKANMLELEVAMLQKLGNLQFEHLAEHFGIKVNTKEVDWREEVAHNLRTSTCDRRVRLLERLKSLGIREVEEI